MTRWKREPTTVLREMLPHHYRWHDYVLQAADSLGCPLGYREQWYWSAGGDWVCARQWYTSTAYLARAGVGGVPGVMLRADVLMQEDDAEARAAAAVAYDAAW